MADGKWEILVKGEGWGEDLGNSAEEGSDLNLFPQGSFGSWDINL